MPQAPHRTLAADECRLLLDLARRAVVARVEAHPPPALGDLPDRVMQPQGAFVTLRVAGELRGCIGMLAPEGSLAEMVVRCAAAAACEDPRFPRMTREEIASMTVEVSALEPPFDLADPRDLEPGRHGLIVSRGGRRGLLLPQVAIEQGWDRETFLRQTCRKAGLPPDAWGRGARLQVFEAQVFAEDESPS